MIAVLIAMSNETISWPERSAIDYFPDDMNYRALRIAASGCRGCELYKNATQTVFGEGPLGSSSVMFVGEQPGDEEDIAGHPFVGPAGRLLDKALVEVGIDRETVYVTNVVKHFRWKPLGKRRLHEKPRANEIRACEPWLAAELEIVRPDVLVCLGATAAQALLGKGFRVTEMRGQWLTSGHAKMTIATVHPSSILRAPDSESRADQYAAFVEDLKVVAAAL